MKKDTLIFEDGRTAIVEGKHGRFLYNRNDAFIGKSLEHYGEWCEPGLDLLLQCLSPGDTVLDIGANIGTHTVAFAKKVGAGGRVVAFEPQRMIFQNLCANISLNQLTNVECHQKGVGAQRTTIHVPSLDPNIEQNFGAFEISGFETGDAVDVVTLDSLELNACRVIKVDVEGMEKEVLSGGSESISRLRPLMFVENNNAEHSEALIDLIVSMDYSAWWVISNYFSPANYFKNTENVFPTSAPSADMFCVPAEQKADIAGLEPVRGKTDTWLEAGRRIVAAGMGGNG